MLKAISLITISIVFLVFTVNINAAIAGNESDSAYSTPPLMVWLQLAALHCAN